MVTVVCKENVGGWAKERCGRLCREARVQAEVIQGEESKIDCVWP